MSKAFITAAIVVAAFGVMGGVEAAMAEAAEVMPQVDHHMHIFSPNDVRVFGMMCKALGPKLCLSRVSPATATGVDALAALDKAGIGRGVLLSTAYFFGSPELTGERVDVRREMREENTFVVGQAAASCGRLIAFISVNPLLPNAVEEVEFWGHRGGVAGVKLHLANSNFDFRDPQQVGKLAEVFQAVGRWHLAIVIHMKTRAKDYGSQDARIFLKEVYPRAAGVPIQIAHAAGGGGVDASELAALETFAGAIQDNPREMRRLYFDLAMVPEVFLDERKIAASAAEVATLKRLMVRIGLDRFLLASDYTPGLDLGAYFADQRTELGLSESDWDRLAGNIAPYMAPASADSACRR